MNEKQIRDAATRLEGMISQRVAGNAYFVSAAINALLADGDQDGALVLLDRAFQNFALLHPPNEPREGSASERARVAANQPVGQWIMEQDPAEQANADAEARANAAQEVRDRAGLVSLSVEEDFVRHRLGITRADWDRHNAPGVVALRAEAPASVEEQVRQRMGLSRADWDRHNAPASRAAKLPGQPIALQVIANHALDGGALPSRLKLLNWGDNQTATKGVVRVGENTLASLPANNEAQGFSRVALDYSHNSLPGHPNFQDDPRKVAAYGRPEVIEGDGLYLTDLEYMPSGLQNAREYRALSPTPLLDADGEVVFLHSVALCPQGEVRGLSFYGASAPLTSQEEAVRQRLGISPEVWRKWNQ